MSLKYQYLIILGERKKIGRIKQKKKESVAEDFRLDSSRGNQIRFKTKKSCFNFVSLED